MTSQRINLIPSELRPKLELPPEMASVGMTLFLVGTILTSMTSSHYAMIHREKSLAAVQAEKAAIAEKINTLTSQAERMVQDRAKFSSVQEVINKKTYWADIFKELTVLMPKGVWLTSLTSVP